MRPGQLKPNEFEVAILERILADHADVHVDISGLHVLSRTFTGVGSYTTFLTAKGGERRILRTAARIDVAGLRDGLGNVVFMSGDELEMLELYTYGDEKWDGVYAGFVIDGDAGNGPAGSCGHIE